MAAASPAIAARREKVAFCLLLKHRRQQQVAVLDRLLGLVLDQTLRTSEPAARRPDRTSVGEAHSDPARAICGTPRVATLEIPVMCALESCQRVVVSPQHAGRRRVELEVLGLERRLLVGPCERLERAEPRTLFGISAGAFKIGHARDSVALTSPAPGLGRTHERAVAGLLRAVASGYPHGNR